MNGLPKPCYVMSEPHLSGYRVVLGYETLTEAQDAQSALAASPPAPARAVGMIAHVSHGRSELPDLIYAALTAREEAPAEGAGEEPTYSMVTDALKARFGDDRYARDYEYLNANFRSDMENVIRAALRSRARSRTSEPEARGAVAWRRRLRNPGAGREANWLLTAEADEGAYYADKTDRYEVEALGVITHPASADKLRVAVAALEVISRASARSETMFGGKMSDIARVFQNITRSANQALAALNEGGK